MRMRELARQEFNKSKARSEQVRSMIEKGERKALRAFNKTSRLREKRLRQKKE